ncbi:hypothetical protein BP5796_08249 [Coleophoma crateriformis]|uniref:Rhodopsin domain-containing protein n=1 Tax=Coleophoma crateriformis TaxID=565419 RepID=A0A3D8RDU9_9HELO|nr:hypothetical protein BP5796_08249 [Coleophoma crateriformis]
MPLFQDDAPHIAATIITITILAYITFGLRVYTRITRISWGIEDWFMATAAFPFAVLAIACVVCSFNGIGVHASRFKEPGNERYHQLSLFWFFLFEVFYCVSIIPIKLSISFMIVRVAVGRRGYVFSQYVVMSMFTTINLIAAFYIIFQCNPVSAAWDTKFMAEGGHCNNAVILADIYYATTAVNIATDWFTALMPIPLLWNCKLNFNAKISVGAILSLGVFASLSACIRLKYTVNLTNQQNDFQYGLGNIVLWGYAENGIGMFVGNLALLRPLFRRIFNLGGSDNRSTGTDAIPKHSQGLPSPVTPFDANCELGVVNGDKHYTDPTSTSAQIEGSIIDFPRSSIMSDSQSQKRTTEKSREPHGSVVDHLIDASDQ